MKTIHVHYNSLLYDQSGLTEETIQTEAESPVVLFEELAKRHGFKVGCGIFKVIINDEMKSLTSPLKDGDMVSFHPPIAGG